MDTQTQDFVSTSATKTNAYHPSAKVYDWTWAQTSTAYQLGSNVTVGYINSISDVDIYYVPNNIGAPGVVDSHHRYLYFATTGSVGGGFAFQNGTGVGLDLEIAQGWGTDDPYYSYLSNFSSSTYNLWSYYWDDRITSDDWLILMANTTATAKYAIASTPQAALAAMTTASTTETPLASLVPVATVEDHTLETNQWHQIADWISYSNATGRAPVQYAFWDSGTAATSGYFWTPNNSHNPANATITVNAADLSNVWVRGGQAGGTETMWVSVFDGVSWSAWDSFTLTTSPNTVPIATIADHSLTINHWQQISNWISYSDANGDAATQYQFWDGGAATTSGYFWTPNNSHNPANATITVNAADLSNAWVRGGQAGGAETMWVRAFDGTDWSAWDSFTLTTLPNTAPVATIADHSLPVNHWQQISSWISYSDANGDAATQYQFWDGGTAATSGYFWTPTNNHNPANTAITVSAADLGNVWVRGGQSGGTETMWVRAFDGTDWSAWDSFTLTTLPNTAPVATIADQALDPNQWQRVSSWVAYSDANGDAATQYQFSDGGAVTTSGYFWTPSNSHNPANTTITVDAADLSNVWVRGGQTGGTETMWIRAFDGTDWSAWDTFTLSTRVAVNGTGANNVLAGGATADALSGGLGQDTLTGNGGSDSFIFNTSPGPQNVDQITDFQPGIDIIELDHNVFSAAIDTVATWVNAVEHTVSDANGVLIYNTNTGALFYDNDGFGPGAPVQFATVSNHPALNWQHDFLVI
jgi:hypothetical protein